MKLIPNLSTQLLAEDVGVSMDIHSNFQQPESLNELILLLYDCVFANQVRLKAVKLLGRLFASPQANYGIEFSRNFRDYLGRYADVSASVRLEMLDNGALIISRKQQLRSLVEGGL